MKFLFSILHKTHNPDPIALPPPTPTVAHLLLNSYCPSPSPSPSPSTPFQHAVAGSKDENFFDSQPWLESDCEDDYYSVKGDFTPSRGNTPVHHNSFSLGNLLVNKTPGVEGNPSPPDRRKRLSELFKDSFHDTGDEGGAAAANRNEAPAKVVPEPINSVHCASKSTKGTPYLSRVSSWHSAGKTPNKVVRAEEENSVKAQCCLPRLVLGYRVKETKKGMSPEQNVG